MFGATPICEQHYIVISQILNEIKLTNIFCQLTFYNVEAFIEVVVEQKDFTAFQQMDPHYVTIVKS